MKPPPPFARRRPFPVVEFCFQSHRNSGHGFSWPNDDDSDSPARRFNEFNREFRREAMRERRREWAVFALMMLFVAGSVFYMLYSVLRLLLERHLLGL